MSSTMYWLPPPKARKENYIGSLKSTIAKHLDPDWNGNGDSWEVGKDIIPFLRGIVAGNGSGDMAREAQSLINGIETYGFVEVVIQ